MEQPELDTLTDQQKEKVHTFMAIIANDDVKIAIQFLESCNFNLEQAINTALATGGNISPNQDQPQAQTPPPPVYDQDPNLAFGGPVQYQGRMEQEVNTALPDFTDEEDQYYQYKLKLSEEEGLVNSMSRYMSGFKSWNPFNKTCGEEFQIQAKKVLNKRRLNINFQNISVEQSFEKISHTDEMPLLIYIHDNEHSLSGKILQEVIQDADIAPYVNSNFDAMGINTSNIEIKILMTMVEKDAIPCILVLRKDKLGKISKIAQIELHSEGYIQKEVVLALLKEGVDNFKAQRREDLRFIRNFEDKQNNRRRIQTGMEEEQQQQQQHQIPAGLYQHFHDQMNAEQQAPRVQEVDPEVERRNIELQSERLLRQEQEFRYEEMKRQAQRKKSEDIQKIKDQEDLEREIALQKEREQQELDRKLEELSERRVRKMSDLPMEPVPTAEGVITIAIRLSNGQRIKRRFENSVNVKSLYDFAYSQEDLGLENEFSTIMLMTSYPPKPLDNEGLSLLEVFGSSGQEMLNVKEVHPED